MMRGWLVALGLHLCACAAPAIQPPAGSPSADGPSADRPSAPSAVEEAEQARAIGALLDSWHQAAARADEEAYFACFTSAAVFLGTDATERWDVDAFRAFAHPYFAKGKAWSFEAVRREVILSPDGTAAWFDEDLATPNLGPARGSGVVLRQQDGGWKIAHYNLALTIPNERLDAVKALLEHDEPPPDPAADDPE